MLNRFRFPPRTVVGLLVLTAVLLTACGDKGSASWAGVSSAPDGERVYVAYERRVVALNIETGEEIWRYSDKDNDDTTFFAIPTADDAGVVYVGDYEGRLHAIGPDGKRIWLYEPDREMFLGLLSVEPKDRVISGVAYDSERVYFGLGSRNVVALDRLTGEYLWDFTTDHGVWATPLYSPASDVYSFTIFGRTINLPFGNGVLYVTSLDHHLYALDPETGDELWSTDLGAAAPDSPVYDAAHNRLYIGTFLSEIIALDPTTHDIVDRYDTEGWVWGSPLLANNTLYFGDLEGYVYAVPLNDDGTFNEEGDWREQVSEEPIRSTPVVAEDVTVMVAGAPSQMDLVLAGSQDHRVYALNRDDGIQVWDEKMDGEVLTQLLLLPATDEKPARIVVGTSSTGHLLNAINATDGSEDWHHSY